MRRKGPDADFRKLLKDGASEFNEEVHVPIEMDDLDALPLPTVALAVESDYETRMAEQICLREPAKMFDIKETIPFHMPWPHESRIQCAPPIKVFFSRRALGSSSSSASSSSTASDCMRTTINILSRACGFRYMQLDQDPDYMHLIASLCAWARQVVLNPAT